MGTPVTLEDRNSPEYLAQLLKDKKQIAALPNVFVHLERLLDEEISKVRVSLFHINTNREPLNLPEPKGPIVPLSEKLYVPVKEYPDFNFVGRILGPRGMTAKQLEQDTGCKIMVRGKGSMRDKKKEEQNRGKPNWEHLNEELHVLITIEDSRNRGEIKLARAVEEVKKLLIPAPEGEDDLKKRQLMELAIINGTYRDTKNPVSSATSVTATVAAPTGVILDTSLGQYVEQPTYIDSSGHCRQFSAQKLLPHGLAVSPALRSPTSPALGVGGAPIIMAPRLPVVNTTAAQNLLGNAPPPLVSPAESGLLYNPYEYPYGAAAAAAMAGLASPTLLSEYPGSIEQSAAGAVPKVRRTVAGMREHPYSRVSLA